MNSIHLNQPLLSLNWNLLFSVVTVVVLFLILKHFFFEKVHNFMVERENEVRKQLENAEAAEKEAKEKLVSYEAQIANAEAEGRDIIKAARIEAKKQADGITNRANDEAEHIIEHAQKEIQREVFNAKKELKTQVGEMALLAAERIMEKDLNPESHGDIINKIIEEADEKPWN